MKIKNKLYDLNDYRLIKLKIIQTKIYKKQHHLENITLENIEYKLKETFRIIYQYHIENKKILFICNNLTLKNKFRKFLKNKKHTVITEYIWRTNNKTYKSTYDLIVLFSTFSQIKKNKVTSKTPTIFFSNIIQNLKSHSVYRIHFFSFLLKTVLKKQLFIPKSKPFKFIFESLSKTYKKF
jgi:hypothetical protein